MKKSFLIYGIFLACFMITNSVSAQSGQKFTLNELSKYNGKNGAKAYVAVNRVVYDVSNLPGWPQGKHFCPGALAGKDISSLWSKIPRSHRKSDFLKRFTVVGTLISEPTVIPSPKPPDLKKPEQPKTPKTANKAPVSPNVLVWVGLAILGIAATIWFVLRSRRTHRTHRTRRK